MNPTLESILDPMSKSEFLEKFYQKKACRIVNPKNKFNNLFTWDTLNTVLNSSPQPHPTVKMSHQGKQFKPNKPSELISAVQNGATLIIENIDRYVPNLGVFLNQFTEEIREETRLNMYLSYPENQGYKNHYDTQDFFIFQIYGYKEWWVFPETIKSASFFQKTHGLEAPPLDSCYLHCTLEPGDVLYVPRGHWHYAISRKEPSLHLTLAMFMKTGIDFMTWLTSELTEFSEFRSNMPTVFHDEKAKEIWIQQMKTQLNQVLDDPSIYERFLRYRTATTRNRQPFQFPNHTMAWNEQWKDVLFRRKQQTTHISKTENKIEIVCSGRVFVFDVRMEGVLNMIFSNDSFLVKNLFKTYAHIPEKAIREVITLLTREGLIYPVIE